MKRAIFLAAAAAFTATASAYPVLQLDILGGVYNETAQSVTQNEESIIAQSNPFTLYALVNTGSNKYANSLAGYYLSAAVTPKGTTPTDPFGSFSISWTDATGSYSQTYSVVNNNMVFGTPPLDSTDLDPQSYVEMTGWPNYPHDLQAHDIFETMYAQIGFTFSNSNKTTAYNVQDDAGGLNSTGSGTFRYQAFTVDTTNLGEDYILHFDLYRANGNRITQFAPFSHDAESGPGHTEVPDGSSTLILCGLGAIGVSLISRRRRGN